MPKLQRFPANIIFMAVTLTCSGTTHTPPPSDSSGLIPELS